MDLHSLRLLEFDRVCASIAERAISERAAASLRAWSPIADAPRRLLELARLDEAIRRAREPGEWCRVATGSLETLLSAHAHEPLEGRELLEVLGWLEAARDTTLAWRAESGRARFVQLARLADELPGMEPLRERLAGALDGDGRVRDEASPGLKRARAGVLTGERRLNSQLEKWSSGFGEGSYVTRFGDRFVACVPAAGFSRKRGIVHDTSNSGQSLFVEPLEACEGNNHLMELRAAAFEEERRILRELAEAARAAAPALLETERVLAELDGLRARARWAGEFDGIALVPGEGPLRLIRAVHPLLALSERRVSVVPLDLELAEDGRLLLVSGPNMGGKTVLLKTVGLAVAMAHAALPVLAAEGSSLPVMTTIVADLGDEQSVDQGLSTFAAHLKSLRAMAEAAGPASLLLADELGAGTDPEEGAALGRALLEHFAKRRAWGVVTTHLGSLKRVASEVPGVVNGSLEFDLDSLTARFRFLPGVPGASHALAVAARLGFPPALLARAKELTPEETHALERLLSEIADAMRRTGEERTALAAARAETAAAAAAHRAAAEDSRRALAELRRRLTSESEALLGRARELWQSVQREARRADKSRAASDELKRGMMALERDAGDLQAGAAPAALGLPDEKVESGPVLIEIGRRVRVLNLGIEAEIASLPDGDGRLSLKRGNLRIQSRVDQLAPAEPVAAVRARTAATITPAEERPPLDVDLRGLEPDDAIREVDQALDRAVVAGFTELRIIHGIGRGVLKAAVEQHLRAHPQVEGRRTGEGHEGGRGVTVARLR